MPRLAREMRDACVRNERCERENAAWQCRPDLIFAGLLNEIARDLYKEEIDGVKYDLRLLRAQYAVGAGQHATLFAVNEETLRKIHDLRKCVYVLSVVF